MSQLAVSSGRATILTESDWLRMRAIDDVVLSFLGSNEGSECAVINLGCG